jgi:hypothetical protein
MISKKLLILFTLVLFSAYTVHQAERDMVLRRTKESYVQDSIRSNQPPKPLPVLQGHPEPDTLYGAKGADENVFEKKPSEE